jgi:ubiquitin-protein ligase
LPDVYATRKIADIQKLRMLAAKMPAALEITGLCGNPPSSLTCRIIIRTAKNENFPNETQNINDIEIQFPERYPIQPPVVQIKTPIWNPNVYTSGKWCFGTWDPTENLELFIIRLMKVIALDPAIINPNSPANKLAADWYRYRTIRQPGLFPTVSILSLMVNTERPKIIFRNRP